MTDTRDIAPVPPEQHEVVVLPTREEIEAFLYEWFDERIAIRYVSLIESALRRWPCVTRGHGEGTK